LSAKASQNEISLDERTLATQAGLQTLFRQPFGGVPGNVPTEPQAGINLIADLAVGGVPFVVLICAALFLPLLWSKRAPFSGAAVAVVFLTLLTAQPPKDSTWAFGVVALGCALGRSDIRLNDAERTRREL
jgi:hypothetical protein